MGKIIVAWAGLEDDVPSGCYLCNGDNDTPDLRGKFILGAYSDVDTSPGDSGGSASYSHTHSISAATFSHTHTFRDFFASGEYSYHAHSVKGTGGDITSGSVGALASTDDPARQVHTTGSGGSSHSHGDTSGSATITLPAYYAVAFIAISDTFLTYKTVSGMVLMWSGSIATIPSGWVLCDGTNGTIDLRKQMIKGHATTAGTSGGATIHTHSESNGEHYHTVADYNSTILHSHSISSSGGSTYQGSNSGIDATVSGYEDDHHTVSSDHGGSGTEDSGGHTHTLGYPSAYADYPPYYVLAYIMKT